MANEWNDLPAKLQQAGAIDKLNEAFKTDGQFQSFTTTDAIEEPATFGVKSSGADSTLLVHVEKGKGQARVGKDKDALFTLVALPEQWAEFFKQTPKMPYQSYWGMFGMNIKQAGIEIKGDQEGFAKWTHVWRRTLELIHNVYAGPYLEEDEPDTNEDHITGRYIYTQSPLWGRTKTFIESSGNGPQEIVFLHTAGSDSRQYHGVMNNAEMRKKCTMYAFDLPGHGRSFPSREYHPGSHTNTEDAYVGCIADVIKRLKLNKPIVCGASMAGQVCLAVAVRNDEVKSGGTIPLQGSDYLNMARQSNDRSPHVNQSLFNPEWIYGMMSPTAPFVNKALIWHLYSAQAYGIFHGDLDFYFGGWDGRDRMHLIDTTKCPVYMLTGEYDWSNTPEMSQKTADKIKGCKMEAMEGLGHFPATENPARFVPYLLKAIDHIQKTRKD